MAIARVDVQPGIDALEAPIQPEAAFRISVIVPVHNGALVLPRCLESLSRSEYSAFEVIVVDDCSTDTTPQIVERYGARYLRTPQNSGPGEARNLGARHAHGDILVFVDADVILPPQGLCLIGKDFRGDAELDAVFGSYDDEPAWTGFISQYKNLMHHYVHQISKEYASTFWSGCGAVRKSVFEEFGGFDAETYTLPSIEDIAFGITLARNGRRILMDKRLTVKHLKRWTLRSMVRVDIWQRAVPWTRLVLVTRYLPNDLNLGKRSRLSSLLVLSLVGALLLSLYAILASRDSVIYLSLAAIGLIVLALLALNRKFYRFFLAKRGLWFAARAVVAHWFYYLYSGVTFVVTAAMQLVYLTFSSAHNPNPRHNST